MKIDWLDLFLIIYLCIGVGHAFTMYYMDKMIEHDTPWEAIEATDVPFFLFLWPFFVYSMIFGVDE